MSTKDHRVWDVYDLFRSALLNVKYYAAKLHRLMCMARLIDGILLASAPSSSISALFFFDTPVGEIIWKYFGIVAAVAAIVKPILKIDNKIKKYEEYLTGYRAYYHDLGVLRIEISQTKNYTESLQRRFHVIVERKKALVESNPEYKENKRLKNRIVDEVNTEHPVDSFFVPSQGGA